MFKVNECRKLIKSLFTEPEYTTLRMSKLAYIKAMCYSNLAGDYEITGFGKIEKGVITEKDFAWAVETASKKKKLDCSSAEFLTIDEGLCVQIMHIGPFDAEPETVSLMDRYIADHGCRNDFSDTRMHHEIYLSDARKVPPEKWKTVIRHPIRKA